MADPAALIEADRRGLLTGDKKAAFDAAKARGLIGAPAKDESLNAIGGISEPSKPEDFRLDSPPFGVLYNMLRGANTSEDALNNAQMMGFEIKPLSDGKSFVIQKGQEKYRYDPEGFKTGFVGSIRPNAQAVGGMAGAILGAPAGPGGVAAGGGAGGVAGGQLADLAVGAMVPRGTNLKQEALQLGQDALVEAPAALGGEIVGHAIRGAVPIAQRAISGADKLVSAAYKAEMSGASRAATTETTEETTKTTYTNILDNLKSTRDKKRFKVAAAVKPDMQLKADARAEGIDLNPAHYSNNQVYQEIEAALKSQPGSALNAREHEAIANLGRVADEIKQEIGGTLDKSLFNQQYSDRVKLTLAKLDEAEELFYSKVKIPKQTLVEPAQIRTYLEKQAENLGGVENLSPMEAKLYARVKEGPITYAFLDRIRKDIGAGYKGRGVFGDADTGQLDQIYGRLAEDQGRIIKGFGFGAEYELAKKATISKKAVEKELGETFGRRALEDGFDDLPITQKVETAISRLTKGDIKNFNLAMQSIPEGMRPAAVGTALDGLVAMGTRSKNGSVGQGFVAAYEALNRNQRAKAALLEHIDAPAAQRLNTLYRVAKGIYQSNPINRGNPSGTARAMIANMDKDAGAFAKIYQIGSKAAAAEGITSSIGIPGAGTVGTIISETNKKTTKFTETADSFVSSRSFEMAIKQYAQGNEGIAEKIIREAPSFKRWESLQPPDVKKQVAAMGALHYLFGQAPSLPQPQTEQSSGLQPTAGQP